MHREGKEGKSSYLLHARLKIAGGGEADTACDLVEVPFFARGMFAFATAAAAAAA